MDIGQYYIGIPSEKKVDTHDIMQHVLLIEELKIYDVCTNIFNTETNIAMRETDNLISYYDGVIRRCRLVCDEQSKSRLITIMRCVVIFYLLILKIGKNRLIITKEIPDNYNKYTHDIPIFIKYELVGTERVCQKYLNLYVVENYFQKVINVMKLNIYDIAGIHEYVNRLIKLPLQQTYKYCLSLYSCVLPAIAIVHRKAQGDDIPMQNVYYTKKCTVCANELLVVEANLVSDIELHIDELVYERELKRQQKELKLIYSLF